MTDKLFKFYLRKRKGKYLKCIQKKHLLKHCWKDEKNERKWIWVQCSSTPLNPHYLKFYNTGKEVNRPVCRFNCQLVKKFFVSMYECSLYDNDIYNEFYYILFFLKTCSLFLLFYLFKNFYSNSYTHVLFTYIFYMDVYKFAYICTSMCVCSFFFSNLCQRNFIISKC